ncbi:DNA translocase FtsK 4TM domain-containing protein [Vibrio sp. SCSIO 43140]|uniref:DNA translocase FtsK 4TM domain-containing protein n=1 Tax=Vibrio sp. SCSIO 43140 TaxID=2819100 RepID=UPI002074EF22|nr:DNA translocase FtsK 4TM domain-containing protein [Vibrio sp. SCSIO 43140]USD61461.1 DNA translocase FtsK 4TM domain-containing protein [Vibrio sp. SCSIO 43140]
MFKQNKKRVETIIKTSEEPQANRLNGFQRLRECCFILAVLTSILLAVALFTFSPADPSWSQTSWGGDIQNAGGFVGAWLADTLFFVFGSLAYPIPFITAFSAWVFFRNRDEDDQIDLMIWGTRLLGLTVLILTSCGLADINFDDIWYFSSGGVIGDVLTSLSLPTLNVLGTTLVLLFLWGAGFTLLTGISWLRIVEWIGDSVLSLSAAIVNKVRGTKEEVYEPVLVDQEADDADELPRFSADSVVEETQPRAKKQYNIHVPESVPGASVAEHSVEGHSFENNDAYDPLFARPEEEAPYSELQYVEEAPHQAPIQTEVEPVAPTSIQPQKSVQPEEPQIERTRQLGATIEELENAARFSDDYANQENEPEVPVTTGTASMTASEEPVIEPTFSEPTFSAESEPINSVEPATFAAENTPERPQQKVEVFEEVEDITPPWIDNSELEVEPETTHIEPTVDFAALEVDADKEVVETPASVDQDVEAFQNMVADAQKAQVAKMNPFLIQQEANLPKPAEPMPTLELLYHPEKRENFIDREALENIARLVESKLADYKIKAEVVDIFPGPVITRFELDLAPGVKVSRISGLSMDLARSLSAMAVRVVEVIPGKPYVGLELPNMTRQTVFFSDVVGSQAFIDSKSPTTVVLGQDIAGEAVVADLSKMPHVLVAGTTGSGKSVGVNVMILSMLYKATPDDVRFIMIDPKMLELSIYEGIPHLLSEVVTDMKDASNALRWCVGEMERRYKLMSALGVRNIKGFNDKLKMAAEAGHPIHDPLWQEGDSMDPEPPLLEKLPYIVVVVDEFADLMMVVGKKVEELIARLAQKARAAGIHLILATQRPSVDVITGLIKANIPTRVAFTVSTKTDSRTILDQGGAESLLGMGDMLYLPPGSSHTIRVHGAFASDDDVHAVVNNWKARGKPNYIEEITNGEQSPETLLPGEKMEGDEEMDPLFDQVVEHVVQSRRGSVSGVQRRFKIGYNRAARIVEQLEAQGIVSAPGHNGNREVLAPAPPKE